MSKRKLSDEQEVVASSMSPFLLVNAFAGSGKTSTIMEHILRRPQKRLLCLVFNRSAREDMERKAAERNVRNAKFQTIHSFAFRQVVTSDALRKRIGALVPNAIAPVFGPILTRQKNRYNVAARLLVDLYESWLRSDLEDVRDIRRNGYTDRELRLMDVAGIREDKIGDCLEKLYDDMLDSCGKFPVTHDGYLKIWQLMSSDRDFGYDSIVVDEAQDTSDCTLSLVLGQRKKSSLMFVGDRYQQIYAWSGCVNSFGKLAGLGVDEAFLSRSFRCPEHIAALARPYLALLGNKVRFEGALAAHEDMGREAIICRTNGGVVNTLMRLREEGCPSSNICLYGGAASYNFQDIFDLAHLSEGKRSEIKSPEISGFETIQEYAEYAADICDLQGKRAADTVIKHGPEHIFAWRGFLLSEPYRDSAPERGGITVSTAHKAKGSEFDHVQLGQDYLNLENIFAEKKKDKKSVPSAEDLRILYVALTRARRTVDNTSRSMYALDASTLREAGKRLLDGRLEIHDVDEAGRPVDVTQTAIQGLRGYAVAPEKQEETCSPTMK